MVRDGFLGFAIIIRGGAADGVARIPVAKLTGVVLKDKLKNKI